MSTDDPTSRDAEFVVSKLKIPYPVLRAKMIAKSYKIEAFPTILVLDQKGVVRFIHVGYTQDLRTQLESDVETLLRQHR